MKKRSSNQIKKILIGTAIIVVGALIALIVFLLNVNIKGVDDLQDSTETSEVTGNTTQNIASIDDSLSEYDTVAKDDDNTFEVLFCSISKRRKLLRSLVNLGLYDITKVNGVEMYRTNNIKIIFKDRLKQAWTFDGEKYRKKEKIYNISLNNKIKFRISSKACEKNCIK